MDHIRRVIIGLGSNVGDRVRFIEDALVRLGSDGDMHVLDRAPLYETSPQGDVAQGDFLNSAVLVVTSLAAPEILVRILGIESAMGRVRTVDKGPRTIDLDILWIEGETIRDEGLTIPHARLKDRSFALRPLVDLAEDARDEQGQLYAELDLAKATLKRFDG